MQTQSLRATSFGRMPGFPPALPEEDSPALDPSLRIAPYPSDTDQEADAMFSKTTDPTAAPAAPTPKADPNAKTSIFGTDLRITGEVVSAGTVEILGEIDGNVTADRLMIGAGGRVSGSIRANQVEVKGRVDGKVDCDTFTMRAAAVVTADVTYASLSIETGSTIEGRFNKAAT